MDWWIFTRRVPVLTVREYIRSNMNLPNLLTLIRLFLVPVYIVVFAMGEKYTALTVFLVASFTDLLDGRIARKYNLITDFGKLMDPLADKVMVLTAMFSMAIGNSRIPKVIPWAAVIVLFLKELIMVIGSGKLLKSGVVVYASMIGKVAQCCFIASLLAVYFHDWFAAAFSGWFMTPDLILMWISVILTLCALVFYVNQGVTVAKEMGLIKPKKAR
ncbi:MAG: CDP-alcohol phosphatidyltransferase family protein [Clostridia bacterium]|nr:CDP-alcohol phosphatidyltransferase family protein [Clostridia bacterium]